MSFWRVRDSCPRPDFDTGCGSSCFFVVPTTATGVCLFVLSRGVQFVEAALAEEFDPAHESCAAVSSSLSRAREEQAWQQEEELPSPHSRSLIATFVRSVRGERSHGCLAAAQFEGWESVCETRRRGPSHPAHRQFLGRERRCRQSMRAGLLQLRQLRHWLKGRAG